MVSLILDTINFSPFGWHILQIFVDLFPYMFYSEPENIYSQQSQVLPVAV